MKIQEIFCSRLARKLGVSAITLYPFIFYAYLPSADIRYHELIHVRQIKRIGLLKFYSRYIFEYCKNRILKFNHFNSYLQVSFEIEAYSAQEEFIKSNQQSLLMDILRAEVNHV